jgi:hypothetical protein
MRDELYTVHMDYVEYEYFSVNGFNGWVNIIVVIKTMGKRSGVLRSFLVS